MNKTTNYELNKPAQNDYYNVADFNENADILDEALNSLDTNLSSLSNRTTPADKGGTGRATLTSNAVLAGNGTNAVKQITTKSGALYATGNNAEPKFGVLPVSQGGTGTNTAQQARANLGITPNNIGAVSKTGDTMTGNLTVESGTQTSPVNFQAKNIYSERMAILQADTSGIAQLWNRKDVDNSQYLNIYPETSNKEDAITLSRRINGETEIFGIFGQHNPTLLATTIQSLLQNGSISVVKQIKRGVVTNVANSSGTITISPKPNADKTCVNLLGVNEPDGGGSVYIYLNGNGDITYQRQHNSGVSGYPTFSWELVEYY